MNQYKKDIALENWKNISPFWELFADEYDRETAEVNELFVDNLKKNKVKIKKNNVSLSSDVLHISDSKFFNF